MIAALMEFTNYLAKVRDTAAVGAEDWTEAIDALVKMLAPTAPHTAEELWHLTKHQYSIHNQNWPKWDEALAKEEEITLVVQVNGKLRDRLTAPAGVNETQAKQFAQESAKVKTFIEGKTVANIIYVPGKLINIVVR